MYVKKCVFCEAEIVTNLSKKIFCDITCKNKNKIKDRQPRQTNCVECGQMYFQTGAASLMCSDECKLVRRNKQQRAGAAKNRSSDVEDVNSCVKCLICDGKFKTLAGHLKKVHGVLVDDYLIKYPDAKIVSEMVSRKLSALSSGENNPGYQHGGRLSPWSPKSEHHTTEQIVDARRKAVKNVTPDKRNSNVEYYLAQGLSPEDAKTALSTRQCTFSLEKCVERHGLEKGEEVFADRQERWQKSYVKTNFSKISQELFWGISEHLGDLSNVYFAQLKKPDNVLDVSGTNNETVLNVGKTSVRPDFFEESQKKIIEFDGDYWHSEARGNVAREAERDRLLLENGYLVHHVKERDFNANKSLVIQECIDFLRKS